MALTLDQLNHASAAEAAQMLDGLYEHSPWIAERAAARRPFVIGIVTLVVLVGGFGTWSVTSQIAGAIMKTGGAIFLWSIVVFLFFKRFSAGFTAEQSYRKDPDSGIENILTFKDVTDAFGRVPPAQEPKSKI